jgi:methylenetetrahydrofolate reductase (NADPH)
VEKLEECKTNEDAKAVGTEWCIKQCRELVEHNVPCLHFYTMNAAAQVAEIMRKVRG